MTYQDMATDLVNALDAARWAQSLGLTLDAWQQQLVRSTSKEIIVCAGRQSGKSFAATVKAVHTTLFEPGSLVLAVSPSLRQSVLLIATAHDLYSRAGADIVSETTTSITLRSGSKILAAPGSADTIRGISDVRTLILDECAFIDDTTIAAVLPMQATNERGQLLMISTPNGKQGFYSDRWHSNDSGLERYAIKADQCSRISAGFLERQRLALPASVFRAEYECSFEDAGGQLFSSDDIARLHLEIVDAWEI